MDTLSLFFRWAAIILLVLLGAGLIQPWWVLWWRDTQNRLQVIKLYGSLAATAYLLSKLFMLLT